MITLDLNISMIVAKESASENKQSDTTKPIEVFLPDDAFNLLFCERSVWSTN